MRMNRLGSSVALATAVVAGVALLSFEPAANAASIGLYNTGVDSSGNVLAGGSVDSHWNGYVLSPGNMYSGWQPDDTVGTQGSAWVGNADSYYITYPDTVYQTFNLSSFEVSTAVITGNWYIDDNGTLTVNGITVASGGDIFYGQAFSIPVADLNAGLNTITVSDTSGDGVLDGLRVSFTQDTATLQPAPLPGTWTMMLIGFVSLGFFAYRGSKKNAAALAAV